MEKKKKKKKKTDTTTTKGEMVVPSSPTRGWTRMGTADEMMPRAAAAAAAAARAARAARAVATTKVAGVP